MNGFNRIDGQLELSLESGRAWAPPAARSRRHSRAQEWFARMREVVDRAMDWEPAPEPRPEQSWFAATHPHAQA